MPRGDAGTDAGGEQAVAASPTRTSDGGDGERRHERIHGEALVPAQLARIQVHDFGEVQAPAHRHHGHEPGQPDGRRLHSVFEQGERTDTTAGDPRRDTEQRATEGNEGEQGEEELHRDGGHRHHSADGVRRGSITFVIDPIVSADWVLAHPGPLVLADVRYYLDGRSGLAAYGGAHLRDAVWVDMDHDLSDHSQPLTAGRHPLPAPEHFAEAMSRLGIGDDSVVIAYDDSGGGTAGRLVWMLRVLGREAALLDGGLDNWPEPLQGGAPPHREPATFTATTWPADRFVTADEIAVALERGAVLIDARAADRYRGETEPIDRIPGHIPGALNAPWMASLDGSGRFREPAELQTMFGELGVGAATETICYCGSGVSACADLLALERAGLGATRLFTPSWSGWSNDPNRPVASGGA